ncbi:hypothetical protein RIF29_17595 [Crotalaria pallida]|uniref:LOB domain-containing protein n=1 Tax=Crotalaria pallida TaxID=3830 RepID=A0AAN9FJL9_CROPI
MHRERTGDERGKNIEAQVSPSQMGHRNKLPCAACRYSRRKCTQDCPFAPYFPANDDPSKFDSVRQIFGAKNFLKLMKEVPEMHRAEAAKNMIYDANMRVVNKVYGCAPVIASLLQQIQTAEEELFELRAEVQQWRQLWEANMMTMPSSSEAVTNAAAQPPPFSSYHNQQLDPPSNFSTSLSDDISTYFSQEKD